MTEIDHGSPPDPRGSLAALGNALDEVKRLTDALEQAQGDVEKWKARTAKLANFNPDWDMLEATQRSLLEHMARIKQLEAAAKWLIKVNGTPERNMELVQLAWEKLREVTETAGGSKPRFEETWCSQCGQPQGPGDSGYSQCKEHRPGAAKNNDRQ